MVTGLGSWEEEQLCVSIRTTQFFTEVTARSARTKLHLTAPVMREVPALGSTAFSVLPWLSFYVVSWIVFFFK